MKILLIAGHGAGDPGAVACVGGKTYREDRETRLLVEKIAEFLGSYVDLAAYPPEQNAYARCRAGQLDFGDAELVVEIHFNAASPDAGNGKVKGVECYIPTAQAEEGCAAAICRGMERLGFANRGVKRKDFAVIAAANAAGIPAVLAEVCFLDDADDMALYESCRDQAAHQLAQTLLAESARRTARDRTTVQEKAGLSDGTMDYLAAYRWGGELLRKLAAAMK